MEEDVELAKKIKFLMEKDVYVIKDTTKYLEFAEHVIQTLVMMEVTVFVIMDTMEIEIIVKNVMILVEHAQVQVLVNV